MGLHLERKEALLAYLEDGSVEAYFITAPTQIGAEQDLQEGSQSLGFVQQQLSRQAINQPLIHPQLYSEIANNNLSYTETLDPGLPSVTYHLHRTREATTSEGHRYIYTAREVTDRVCDVYARSIGNE